jgi:hypothetical protein
MDTLYPCRAGSVALVVVCRQGVRGWHIPIDWRLWPVCQFRSEQQNGEDK